MADCFHLNYLEEPGLTCDEDFGIYPGAMGVGVGICAEPLQWNTRKQYVWSNASAIPPTKSLLSISNDSEIWEGTQHYKRLDYKMSPTSNLHDCTTFYVISKSILHAPIFRTNSNYLLLETWTPFYPGLLLIARIAYHFTRALFFLCTEILPTKFATEFF